MSVALLREAAQGLRELDPELIATLGPDFTHAVAHLLDHLADEEGEFCCVYEPALVVARAFLGSPQ